MPRAVIVRGLPGSGKSTWVFKRFEDQIIAGKMIHASADNYFYKEDPDYGEIRPSASGAGIVVTPGYRYEFNPALLPQAHAECQKTFIKALSSGKDVVLDNTCSQIWEYMNYVLMAVAMGYDVEILSMQLPQTLEEAKLLFERQQHGVPLDIFLKMWWRWETDPNETVIEVMDVDV
jgi:predicted kinase